MHTIIRPFWYHYYFIAHMWTFKGEIGLVLVVLLHLAVIDIAIPLIKHEATVLTEVYIGMSQ